MRELVYAVEGKAANLQTFATDEPGHGGACHEFVVYKMKDGGEKLPDSGTVIPVQDLDKPMCVLKFQNGPINEKGIGVNGVQHEDLLAVIIDRLEGFQSGPYKSAYNGNALQHCRAALTELQNRTRERIKRKVEGTHQV